MSSRAKTKQANRIVREQLAAEARRRRTVIVSVVAAAVLVIAGLVGLGVYLNQAPPASFAIPAAAGGGDRTGIPVGSGPVPVNIYLDYLCPICNQFEQSAQSTLDDQISKKKITVTYHPIAILNDRSNPSGYSTRAGSAAACASDAGKFLEYTKALYGKQPAEGSAGMSDDQLVDVGTSVGLTSDSFAQCVRSEKYSDWMAHNTDTAASKNINGTPTILVNGKPVDATVSALLAAIG